MYLLFRLGILQIQRQPHSYYRSLLFTFRQGLWSVFPPMICSLEGRGMLQNRSFVYTDARCGDWWLWLLLLMCRRSNRFSWFAAAYVLMDVYLLIKFFVNCVWNYLQIWLCCVMCFKNMHIYNVFVFLLRKKEKKIYVMKCFFIDYFIYESTGFAIRFLTGSVIKYFVSIFSVKIYGNFFTKFKSENN